MGNQVQSPPCPACDERKAEVILVKVHVTRRTRVRLKCAVCEHLWWAEHVDEQESQGHSIG